MLGREAVELLEATDALDAQAKARLDLVDVYLCSGRTPDECRELVDEALRLYELKGNLVGADRARSLLSEPAGRT